MKKILLALVALLLVAGLENKAAAQFRYGPTAGLTVSNLHFKQDLFSLDPAVGYSGGIMAEMIFPGLGFGIDFGAMYEQRGAVMHLGEKKMWASQGYGTERQYLHYLEIPLHLRFKYTNLNGLEEFVAPFVFGGPDFGFLLGKNKLGPEHKPDFKKRAVEYAGGQIGLSVGGGVELYKHWQVSLSYTWGVTYALKMAVLSNDSGQNRTWNVRVAYLF